MFSVVAFYKFVHPAIECTKELQLSLKEFCALHNIKGTIILADEGINGTVCGAQEDVELFKSFMHKDFRFKDVSFKHSECTFIPFEKMKVKIKPEIVTLRQGYVDMTKVGNYVSPAQWDEFISRSDVILVDGRNDYEYHVGTFDGAINTETENFRDFPSWVDKNLSDKEQKIATFCTGGIRCEKSTAFLKEKGFKNVYHLEGGILNYLSSTGNKNKKWVGDCFVFDDRVALKEGLQEVFDHRKDCQERREAD